MEKMQRLAGWQGGRQVGGYVNGTREWAGTQVNFAQEENKKKKKWTWTQLPLKVTQQSDNSDDGWVESQGWGYSDTYANANAYVWPHCPRGEKLLGPYSVFSEYSIKKVHICSNVVNVFHLHLQ